MLRMSEQIEVRPYRPQDEPDVVALAKELQSHELGLFDRVLPVEYLGAWYVNRILSDAKKAGGDLLVALVDGEVLGYATLFTCLSSEEDYDETLYTFAHVGDLAVKNSSRGKGIGRKLLQACEKMARDAGQKWLRVSVLATNTAAHRLYESQGFRDQLILLEKPLS